jgi:hypothetical protein
MRLRVGETPDGAAPDSNVWVFAGGRGIERPRVAETLHVAARSLAVGPSRYLDVPSTESLLYSLPVTDEERERIFEPGVRGEAAETNGARGSGLGLSLARRLARSVAGDVEAAGGARFVVRLPAG